MIELDNRVVYWRATKYGPASANSVAATRIAGPDGKALATYDGHYVKQWVKRYKIFQSLPVSAQEAVAVLSMNTAGERTLGVGMRVSQFVYWLEDARTIREIEHDNTVPQEK